MDQPLMTARDTTFTWGQIGIGTFDAHGYQTAFMVGASFHDESV